ncbi:hypothetical protein, partial [Faecalibacillus intestinalis]|uniref:hypothetical protein n=1 Tax=Faecalibacillus intestinalis TaxID=1982626 RepID=UPI002E7772BD
MKGFEVYEYDIDENKKIIIINIEEISTELEEEINRYEFTTETSPEISIIRNYIDWLISLPWNKSTRD